MSDDILTGFPKKRISMKCVRCNGFSSTRVCWSCSQRIDAVDFALLESYKMRVAEALREGCKDIPPEFAKIVDEKFWELLK